MSILIKSMEMPKSCDDCPFGMCLGYKESIDHEIHCTLIKEIFMEYPDSHERRHKDCPLVEVKEPHGDLIDRGDLLAFLNENLSTHPDALSWSDYGVIDLIEARSTVVEAEGNDEV